METRQSLLDEYRKRKTKEDRDNEKKTSQKKTEEAKKEKHISAILKAAGTMLSWTNGYVYRFDHNGLRYTVCDQTERTVGESHIIPETIEDEKFLGTEAHFAFMGDGGNKLKAAFKHTDICISLPIESAIITLIQ